MDEIYKIINGADGYSISNLGNVKNLKYDRILKPIFNKPSKAYAVSIKYNNGKFKQVKIHKLVWLHFSDVIIMPKKHIGFINGDKANCNIDNLELRKSTGRQVGAKGKKPKKQNPVKKEKKTTQLIPKINYINDSEMLYEVILSKGKGQLTDKLIRIFIKLSERMILKFNYYDEAMKQDCQSHGIEQLLIKWRGFDEEKFDKALPYYSEIYKRGLAEGFNIQRNIKHYYKNNIKKMISLSDCYNL